MSLLIMILGSCLLVMAAVLLYTYAVIIPRYESHWKATEHELNVLWGRVNVLETNTLPGDDLMSDLPS